MGKRAKLQSGAPILLTSDVVAAADYYVEKVGFELVGLYGEPPNFTILKRDGLPLMLAQVPPGAVITPNWQVADKTCNIYYWVDDVDAIYAELQERGAIIDFTLYATPWGTREFGIQDLDDHDIAFGEVVE